MWMVIYTQKPDDTLEEQRQGWLAAAEELDIEILPDAGIEEIKQALIQYGNENFYDFTQTPNGKEIMWGFIID